MKTISGASRGFTWITGSTDPAEHSLLIGTIHEVLAKHRLPALFCQGASHPRASGFETLELLDVRSALARWEEKLTPDERQALEEADRLFLEIKMPDR